MAGGPFDTVAEWNHVAPEAKRLWRGGAAIAVAVAFGPTAAGAWIVGGPAVGGAVIAVALGVFAWTWWLAGRRWEAWGYAERDADLLIRRGVLFRRLSVVPYGRMQFVDVAQGPLDRLIGTANVRLHTAAAATDASVALLPEEEARRLRDRLAALGEAQATGV